MNHIKLILMMSMLGISQVYASLCTAPMSNKNVLINRIVEFTDTSPIFKTQKLTSYKEGSWDIDVDEFTVGAYGNKIKLTGNSWKMLWLDEEYTVTPNSVLEFEFRSNGDEAEVNGVGLVMYGSIGFNGNRFFQVHGTQAIPSYNQNYHNYSGDQWVRYQIPLWSSTSNSSEKRITKLVFAGDDDNAQVNQKTQYKNVRIVEGIPSYQLPSDFEHFPVNIVSTTNPNFVSHIYSQKITGPDNIVYPVSDGSIILKYHAPPNTNIQNLISVQENYYENMCWDSAIAYSETAKEQDAWNRLQNIAVTENINELLDVVDNGLSQDVISYFDPEFISVGNSNYQNKSPIFVHEYSIRSINSENFYIDKISAQDGQLINNGITSYSALNNNSVLSCSTPNSGSDTTGICHDLDGLTTSNNGFYESQNTTTTVKDGLELANPGSAVILTDLNNIWDETAPKEQATELLVYSDELNDYLNIVGGKSYQQITGWKINSIVNSRRRPSLFIPPSTLNLDPLIWLRSKEIGIGGGDVGTDSKSISLIGHEFAHALTYSWFGNSLAENDIQGCAINEGFADIFGIGLRKHVTGIYNSTWLSDLFVTISGTVTGTRNISNPLLTNNKSFYDGDNNLIGSCSQYGVDPVCSNPSLRGDNGECEIEGITSVSTLIDYHSMGTIIGHLYHLMVTGGFNADSQFEPDSFGISDDETFSHLDAQKIFFEAMISNKGESTAGSVYTFCDLRDDMLSQLGDMKAFEKTAVQQAWKHVYKDIQTICPVQSGLLLEPEIKVWIGGTQITLNDGDQFDLGDVQHGQTVTKTLAIKNTGEYPLRLINPVISNDKFKQSTANGNTILSETQTKVVIEENDTDNDGYPDNEIRIDIEFTADASDPTFNYSTFTFETNLPNGTNDQHFFTLNLKASSIQPQGDAYEEDDILSTASGWSSNERTQNRNFFDDATDYISLNAQPDPISICIYSINNIDSNINLCIDKYEIGENQSSVQICNITNNDDPYVIETSDGCPGGVCTFYDRVLLSNQSTGENTNYKLDFNCSFLE